jgi:hypothetical protein
MGAATKLNIREGGRTVRAVQQTNCDHQKREPKAID